MHWSIFYSRFDDLEDLDNLRVLLFDLVVLAEFEFEFELFTGGSGGPDAAEQSGGSCLNKKSFFQIVSTL